MTPEEMAVYVARLFDANRAEIVKMEHEFNEKEIAPIVFGNILLSFYANCTQNLVNYLYSLSGLPGRFEVFMQLMRQMREGVGEQMLLKDEYEERTKGYH